MDKKTLLWAALGLVSAGAIVYYLSNEHHLIKFDPKKHTVEKLRKIFLELKLDYICIYVRNYNFMLKNEEYKNQLAI